MLYNDVMPSTLAITKAARELRRKLTPPPALTQRQLSEKLGVTQQAISAWMRGISRPDPQRRELLEALTGVRAGDWDEDSEAASAPALESVEDGADGSGEYAAVSEAADAKPTGTS